MDGNFEDTPEKLAADVEKWAETSFSRRSIERLKADVKAFAERARAFASAAPVVRAVDENGRALREGFYFEFPSRQGYPIGDGKPEDIPVRKCVACYDPGDWGLANTPRLAEVTPPHRIVPAGRWVRIRGG